MRLYICPDWHAKTAGTAVATIVAVVAIVFVVLVIVCCRNKSSGAASEKAVQDILTEADYQDVWMLPPRPPPVAPPTNGFELVDRIIYINLDHRTDRDVAVREMLSSLLPKPAGSSRIIRLAATHNKVNGHLGCAASHIRALEMALAAGWRNLLIVEDDARLCVEVKEAGRALGAALATFPDYDVMMLGGCIGMRVDMGPVSRILNAHSTTAYIVSREMMRPLRDNFATVFTDVPAIKCIDQTWKLLQARDRFYMPYPKLMDQRPSLSDISGSVANYDQLRDGSEQGMFPAAAARLFVCWFGPPMSAQRRACLRTMGASRLEVVFIDEENLEDFVVDEFPLHGAWPYLSSMHKVDYLRCYLMHVHGGGYSDIKRTSESWLPTLKEINDDPHMMAAGFQEAENGMTAPNVRLGHENLIGNSAFICKANTPLTHTWFTRVNRLLDERMAQAERYPARHAMQVTEPDYAYPFAWADVQGNIFHPINYVYRRQISRKLPRPQCTDYRAVVAE